MRPQRGLRQVGAVELLLQPRPATMRLSKLGDPVNYLNPVSYLNARVRPALSLRIFASLRAALR